MARKSSINNGFTSPERRLTKEITASLEALAPLFLIQVKHLPKQRVELSGAGFSEGAALILPAPVAKVRLLAEICSILARWVSFNLWEPCEITLFAVQPSRIERCAFNWRKQLAQSAKAAARAAAAAAIAQPMEMPVLALTPEA
jgi:hypothetical protein